MAETYSVKAVLSAYDKGFTSAMKQAGGATDSLGKKLKSGLSFGVFAGIGQQAFSMVTDGARDLISEIDSSNAAWKTFNGNMQMLGKGNKEINKAKKTMQEYAEQTVYSSSDMAQTYAQLAAVGIKSTDKLVTGFGGLAAAAENPQQAMKTLSQQATQMAAKPTVAWQDFKLMLEQTPAGIAAVAKEMGMSTQEMVTKVQDGKIKTKDFFDAIKKVGNNKAFSKMATEAKTMGQAMDGLQETMGNKLGPAFDVISNIGIKAINGIADSLAKIDGNKIAENVSGWIKKAQPYWESFKKVALAVGSAIGVLGGFLLDHGETIAKILPYVLGLALAYKGFKIVSSVIPGVMSFTKSITGLANGGIKGLASKLFGVGKAQESVGKSSAISAQQMVASAKAFMMMGAGVLLVSAGFALLALSAVALANAGPLAIGVMAGLVISLAALGVGMAFLLKMLAPMSAQLMPAATAMLAMGAAVLIVSASFALLAYTSIQLANSGGLAIGVMVGMVAAIALLAVGAALLGPALTAGAVGFIAFGAALLMVGTAVLIASAGLALLATQLPIISQYGLQGSLAIGALGASMVVFALGAAVAGVACIALAAGLLLVGAAILVVGAGTLVTAAGMTLLGASLLLVSAGLTVASAGALALSVALITASGGSVALGASLLVVSAAVLVLSAGLLLGAAGALALGAGALVATAGMVAFGAAILLASAGVLVMNVALKGVNSSMKTIAKNAKSTEKSLNSMKSSVSAVESGLNALGSKAKSAMKSLMNAFDSTEKKAKTSGKNVGNGFSKGMQAGLLTAPVIATTSTMAVYTALNSGQSKAYNAGANISKGFANGMLSQMSTIQRAANKMVAAADKAVCAKAKIHSPSRLFEDNGEYMGEGQEKGMLSKLKDIWKAGQKFVQIPQVKTPNMNLAYAGGLNSDYTYTRNNHYTVVVPLEVDGKEFAKATFEYTEDEINKKQRRESRKLGRA